MASKIKVDQLEGSTGSTITIPTGQTFTVTDGIPVASGGTGLASFTAGDILYATGATTLTKLNKGTAEQVLAMNAGATAPDWGSIDLTVLPTITVAKGGTNLSSFTAGDILYATGATTLAKLAKGTATQIIAMNAGATAPEWVAQPSGVWESILNTSCTTVTQLLCDNVFSSTYHVYKVFINGFELSATTQRARLRLINVGGTVNSSTDYNWAFTGSMIESGGSGSAVNTGGYASNSAYLGNDVSTAGVCKTNYDLTFYNPMQTNHYKAVTGVIHTNHDNQNKNIFGAWGTNIKQVTAYRGFMLQGESATTDSMSIDKVQVLGLKLS